MAIWEPCNYVSNLAYDRLVVEICKQQDWTLDQLDVRRIAEAYALITFGSTFFHGSETKLGMLQDNISNNLFTYILHQVPISLLLCLSICICFKGLNDKYSIWSNFTWPFNFSKEYDLCRNCPILARWFIICFLSNITGWDFRYVSVQGCYTMEPNSTNCWCS